MAEKPWPDPPQAGRPARPVEQIRPQVAQARSELRDALSILSLFRLSIVAVTLVMVGLALFVSTRQTPIYESQTRVLVNPVDVGNETVGEEGRNLATEAELVSSVAVAQIVADNLDTEGSPRDLLEALNVDRPADTEILTISYSHSDPQEARRRAQGFAEGYLEYRRGTASDQVAEAADALQQELTALTTRLSEVERALLRLAEDDPGRATLESEAALLQQLILQAQLDELDLPTTISAGRIVEPAAVPADPVSPNHIIYVALGFVAGAGIGVGQAFARDRLSGRLRSLEDVEEQLQTPVLGSIPRVPGWRKRKEAFLVTLRARPSPASESYRILRTNVLSAASRYGAKSIVVTSPYSGEGKSATVANLGVVLATAGKRVSLVSADLRRPRLHQFFGADGSRGLTDVLSRRAPLDHVVLDIALATSPWLELSGIRLRILPSGQIPDDPAELLASEALRKIIRTLEDSSDVVLIDAPPILPVTDAQLIGQVAGGILVVLGPRSIDRASILATRQQMDKVNVRVIGAVVNGADVDAQVRYSY